MAFIVAVLDMKMLINDLLMLYRSGVRHLEVIWVARLCKVSLVLVLQVGNQDICESLKV